MTKEVTIKQALKIVKNRLYIAKEMRDKHRIISCHTFIRNNVRKRNTDELIPLKTSKQYIEGKL